MKALVLKEYMKLVVEDVPVPVPGPGEVLVRVKACGICGSDIHGMDGSTGRRRPPVIMGHEASGVVEKLGPGAGIFKQGDRVAFDSTIWCGTCWYCRRGDINLCDNRRVLGVSCEDYRQNGAFAEYVVVPERIMFKLPDQVSFEHSAMIEALSIAMHAAERAKPAIGDTLAVVGAGMIGLLIIQCLKAAGAGTVVAVDLDAERLAVARELGADCTVKSDSEDPAAFLRKVTDGRGADGAVEVVGIGPAFDTALNCVRKGGKLTLVGNLTASVPFGMQAAVTRELSILGSCASRGEIPVCLDYIGKKKVNVQRMISAVAPLEDGPAWFKRLHDREKGLMKVILKP
jgi:L-iditol 2-dehydrogenase